VVIYLCIYLEFVNKNIKKISKKEIEHAVHFSSRLEGISFLNAKKNKKAIKILKVYDRAFSL